MGPDGAGISTCFKKSVGGLNPATTYDRSHQRRLTIAADCQQHCLFGILSGILLCRDIPAQILKAAKDKETSIKEVTEGLPALISHHENAIITNLVYGLHLN